VRSAAQAVAQMTPQAALLARLRVPLSAATLIAARLVDDAGRAVTTSTANGHVPFSAGERTVDSRTSIRRFRRGLVVTSCDSLQLLTQVVQGNPPLNTLFTLLNAPALAKVCPGQVLPTSKTSDKKTPKLSDSKVAGDGIAILTYERAAERYLSCLTAGEAIPRTTSNTPGAARSPHRRPPPPRPRRA